MGGQIPATSKRSREKPGAFHILHRTLSVITTKPLPVLKAWRKWLTLFAWHEPVLACLFHHHEIFQTFYVRQARFTCQQANVFDSDQKHFCFSASKCWFFYACLPVSPCRFGCWRNWQTKWQSSEQWFWTNSAGSFVRPLASVMTVFSTSLIWYSQKPGLRTGPNISSFPGFKPKSPWIKRPKEFFSN